MSRSAFERVADVRRLLAAAGRVYAERARLAPHVARSTGLSLEGVDLGFASLEREATLDDLTALVASAGSASHVHVILSANVFVAPLRALALARAASPRVTVWPSSRDPFLALALVAEARDPAITFVPDRRCIPHEADRIDVYGRDETIAEVRARARPGIAVRGHGAGLGIAIVTASASLAEAAEALASDVVPFDQRGCLSPRAVLVAGASDRGEAFAAALHERLVAWGRIVPRGALTAAERADAARWKDALLLAGRVWSGDGHAVALVPADSLVPAMGPPGRHVLVASVESLRGAREVIECVAPFVVSVGTDAPGRIASEEGIVPPHARLARLGSMQRPPFDGPVDRRGSV